MIHVKRIIQLAGMQPALWNESHDVAVKEFLTLRDKKVLVFYIDKEELIAQFEVPSSNIDHFTYFVKSYYTQEIDKIEKFSKCVQYGNFSGKHLENLLRLTSGLYAPVFFGNSTWPDSKSSSYH
jgi:hypothetical protein